jgi:hypothetical protein
MLTFLMTIICVVSFSAVNAQSKYGPNDTILVPIIIYNGDTLIYGNLEEVIVSAKMT